jgi:LemA protein
MGDWVQASGVVTASSLAIGILLVFAAGFIVWVIWTFNRLVKARNQQAEAWSGVDVQLKKRADLVPPLAACVAAYARHEKAVQESAASARNSQENAVPALRQLIAIAESYPELKADQNFRDLSTRLVAIEDDLQYARRYYNGSVRDFRNLAESFPTNLVATTLRFQPGEFFEVENVLERANPTVAL